MLPPLVPVEQFAVRIPGGVADDDRLRAEAALSDASTLVRSEAGQTWVDADNRLTEVPDAAVAVTIAAARRAFVNPDMVASESIQDFSQTFGSASADIYLTKAERTAIRRLAGRSGLWSLATTRSDVGPDVPAVRPDAYGPVPSEESDPFVEGWG